MAARIQQRFGRRLRELRRSVGLTQAELAEACGVSTKLVGAVERGEQSPSLVILDKLAQGLDVDIHELMFMEHHGGPQVLRSRIHAWLSGASDDDLRMIYQVVRAILAHQHAREES